MSNSLNIKWLAVIAMYIYNMITKRLILVLLLLIPSLLSYSKLGPPQFLRLQVNVSEAFLQDTVTQKIILEFIEDAQLAEGEFLEVLVRGEKEYSMRLSQHKANWLRRWILENISVPIKIVAIGFPEDEHSPMDYYERDLNMSVYITVVRE